MQRKESGLPAIAASGAQEGCSWAETQAHRLGQPGKLGKLPPRQHPAQHRKGLLLIFKFPTGAGVLKTQTNP